jgi:hypothetical protein
MELRKLGLRDVRYGPNSDQILQRSETPLWAMSRHCQLMNS